MLASKSAIIWWNSCNVFFLCWIMDYYIFTDIIDCLWIINERICIFFVNIAIFLVCWWVIDTSTRMDLWCVNKFCQHLIVDVLLASVRHWFCLILSYQWLKSYQGGQKDKVELDCELFWLDHHNISSSIKIWHDYLAIITLIW